jgi:hypothetical protein
MADTNTPTRATFRRNAAAVSRANADANMARALAEASRAKREETEADTRRLAAQQALEANRGAIEATKVKEAAKLEAAKNSGGAMAMDLARKSMWLLPAAAGAVVGWKLGAKIGAKVATAAAGQVANVEKLATAIAKTNVGNGRLLGTARGDKLAGQVAEATQHAFPKVGERASKAVADLALPGFLVGEGALTSYVGPNYLSDERAKEAARWIGSGSVMLGMGIKSGAAIAKMATAGTKLSPMARATIRGGMNRLAREGALQTPSLSSIAAATKTQAGASFVRRANGLGVGATGDIPVRAFTRKTPTGGQAYVHPHHRRRRHG